MTAATAKGAWMGMGVGLALATLAAFPAVAEAPRDLHLSYKVWTGGFNSLGIEASLRRTATDYRIGLEGQTRGMVGWLWPYKLKLEAAGELGREGVAPRHFRQVHDDDGRQKRREIRYGDEGRLELRLDGQPKPLDDGGLSQRTVQGALDPASAFLSLIEVFARERRCVGLVRVFDGKRRYDLRLAGEDQVTLSPSRYALYSGPATRCRLALEAHAGFRKSSRFPRAIDVWLAQVAEGAPALPVRMVGRNDLAAMVIHLTGLRPAGAAEQARR